MTRLAFAGQSRQELEARRLLEGKGPGAVGEAGGTPWDGMAAVYCSFHRDAAFRSHYCAIAIARKSCFAVFQVGVIRIGMPLVAPFQTLRDAYDLPFERSSE